MQTLNYVKEQFPLGYHLSSQIQVLLVVLPNITTLRIFPNVDWYIGVCSHKSDYCPVCFAYHKAIESFKQQQLLLQVVMKSKNTILHCLFFFSRCMALLQQKKQLKLKMQYQKKKMDWMLIKSKYDIIKKKNNNNIVA